MALQLLSEAHKSVTQPLLPFPGVIPVIYGDVRRREILLLQGLGKPGQCLGCSTLPVAVAFTLLSEPLEVTLDV